MPGITIPRKSLPKKDDLVIVPRKHYERLLKFLKFQSDLDAELRASMEDVQQGRVYGPFNTAEEMMRSLEK